jgi:multidrug transporter EmrE-like cation transporter
MKLFLMMLPTILLTAYCQLVVKWRVTVLAASAADSIGPVARAIRYLFDPFVLSAFAASFLSAIAWLYVAERYPVSIAFPSYVGVLFAIVTVGSALLLSETISAQHILGLVLILAGVIVVSQVS